MTRPLTSNEASALMQGVTVTTLTEWRQTRLQGRRLVNVKYNMRLGEEAHRWVVLRIATGAAVYEYTISLANVLEACPWDELRLGAVEVDGVRINLGWQSPEVQVALAEKTKLPLVWPRVRRMIRAAAPYVRALPQTRARRK